MSLSDTLPAGLVVATPNGLTGSCGGGTDHGYGGLVHHQPVGRDASRKWIVHL